ncbi:MAG: RNA 2',3'-cyclic phosphodiesterase [Rhodobacteraceae bacterium]|nr:RNA 2',3'-cyclic phosphodiesterase [Paracoccaceae bacterium]
MIRAFLALEIPRHICSQLVLQQYLLPIKRKVPPENFHITLVFLGDCRVSLLEELHLQLMQTRLPALRLQIKGLGLFGKRQPHNLHARLAPCPELERIQARLERMARGCGVKIPARRFTPHVTLSYLRPGSFEPAELEAAVARDALFQTDPFDVSQMALMRSTLRADGAVHDVLEHYPLGQGGCQNR